MAKGRFDLEDYASAAASRSARWAACRGILGMLPGMGKIRQQLEDAKIDTKMLKRQEAIISR